MDGPVAPKEWQGGLPITYRMGGAVTAHVKVEMDNSTQPYYVVEARIKGSELPDEWVLLGNHHDAWVHGGVDPSSGTASMMEMTRAFGAMLKDGKRPRRTLVFCSWDGEEVGLTGSTEWGEQFAEELRTKLVAYLNVDSSAAGPNFHGGASGSLAPFLVETSRSIQDPGGGSLHDAWLKSTAQERKEEHDTQPVADANVVNTRIGSGSDHTVFLNFLGRPVITLEFDGPYGVYHSMYDDFYWMDHFGDPGYRYHAAMSQLWGVTALRLAQADVLPLDFEFYGETINQFLNELEKNKKFEAAKLNLTSAHQATKELQSVAAKTEALLTPSVAGGKLTAAQRAAINQLLMQGEANFILPEGIPGRPWFKHMLYSARYTYAHLELPAITEAVESGNWPEAQRQTKALIKALNAETALMEQLAAVVQEK
jgi:N-acetylated-alpha-linked acidic dipeptidase